MKPYRMHVMLCAGTGCVSNKAFNIRDALEKEITKQNLQDEVAVVTTGCNGFCAQGPVMVIQPDEIFYQLLTDHGFSPTIQTAFIERINLTLRRGVASLMRKTWSLAQSPEHLFLHTQWWRAYYHFVRPHDSLQLPVPGLARGHILRTPAMAAGVTEQLWSVGTILKMPLYPSSPG